MRRFYYPNKDASIYQELPTRQAGLDEILEVGKTDKGRYRVRSLVGFDILAISASLADGTISPASQFEFTTFLAKADKLQLNQTITAHQVSSSWIEGSGYFYQDMRESTDGTTWYNAQTGSHWASYTSSILSGGADYYTSVGSSLTRLSLIPWVSSSSTTALVFTTSSVLNTASFIGDSAAATISATNAVLSGSFTTMSLFMSGSPTYSVDTTFGLLYEDYSGLPAAWMISSSQQRVYAMQNASTPLFSSSVFNYTTSSVFSIIYDSSTFKYYIDGVLVTGFSASFTKKTVPYFNLPSLSGSGVTNIWYGEYVGAICNSASIQTSEPITDLTFDVTCFVRSWVSSSIPNYGMIIKFNDAGETDATNWGNLKLFSRNTHTVFSPVLVAKWDDSVYSTGSWTSASSDALTVYPVNLRPEYKQGEVARIDLVARELYPAKTFTTQFEAWKNRYLPRTSYYSVVDVQSQEVIIPFDDNSKISVDAGGNYILMAIDKMFPRRYYKLMFKIVFSDGHRYIIDEHTNFTVVL